MDERSPTDEERAEAADSCDQIAAHAVEPPSAEPEVASAAPAEPEAKKPNVARGAAFVTIGILLSRLVGLVRQRVQAHYFRHRCGRRRAHRGAFRLGNITQNLLGEGTLSATFIPIYAKLRAEGRTAEARKFALASLGLPGVDRRRRPGGGALLAPWLSLLIAAGFDEARREATVSLVRILFPMGGLLVLSAWALGVLNAHRQFFLPYAARLCSGASRKSRGLACVRLVPARERRDARERARLERAGGRRAAPAPRCSCQPRRCTGPSG